MKRSVTLFLMSALLASVPVLAAPPFGSFGGVVGGANAGAGLLPIHGWALDDDGIAAVDILVDGTVVGRADYHRNRPRVAILYPGYPDSAASGYAFFLDTTHFLNGIHQVTARAQSKTGEFTTLNTKVLQFLNVTHNLVPFGKIEFPAPQAELRGNCNLTDPARRYSVLSGYALDAGVQEDDTGVGYVEMMIDRSLFSNSREDCFFDNIFGGFTNCYGLRRVDLEPMFPGLKDAPHSGFRYVFDVGALIAGGFYLEGAHVLTIRSGDHFGQVSNIQEIPVTFVCDEGLGNEQAVGQIDPTLKPYVQVSGNATVTGWALDWEGISRVTVLIDGATVGEATRGLIRTDVSSLYLGYPQSAAPGWQLTFNSTLFSNGPHEIEVLVTDNLGADTYIGKRPIVIVNPRP